MKKNKKAKAKPKLKKKRAVKKAPAKKKKLSVRQKKEGVNKSGFILINKERLLYYMQKFASLSKL